jgi:FkbM family methyltransferase
MEHQSFLIRKILSEYLSVEEIESIWEIGSRDGQDGKAMGEAFGSPIVISFEPNPDTFEMVQKVASKSNGKMIAKNLALSDIDGLVTFFKIDTEKTKTTWGDGNPGASSMFPTNGEYDIEDYIQIPIEVSSVRGDSFIDLSEISPPDLIWMDVQGAEKLVLEGFGSYLVEVDAIYAELSLRSIYAGQALAYEVVELLSKNFCWHSNLSFGEWQFDALFVNKKHANLRLKFRSCVLRYFLKKGIGFSISYPPKIKTLAKRLLSRSWNSLIEVFRRSNSRTLGLTSRKLAFLFAKIRRNRTLPHRVRTLLSLAQPIAPLKVLGAPVIDVVIPCHSKDFATLELTIESARTCVLNPIGDVKLITNSNMVDVLSKKFPDCLVFSDEYFLSPEMLQKVSNQVLQDRQGWVFQQLIKFAACLQSDKEACLVLDADTILIQPRVWLDSAGVQILSISEEYHTPYVRHYSSTFGRGVCPWSFVTHHQLMQRDVLRSMFDGLSDGLLSWLNTADFNELSAISEYHSYGQWIVSNRKELVRFVKWNNVIRRFDSISELSYGEVSENFSKYCSVSAHSYLQML